VSCLLLEVASQATSSLVNPPLASQATPIASQATRQWVQYQPWCDQ